MRKRGTRLRVKRDLVIACKSVYGLSVRKRSKTPESYGPTTTGISNAECDREVATSRDIRQKQAASECEDHKE